MMDFKRWPEMKAILQQALDRPEAERGRYLDEACKGNEELRREVEALLAVSSTRADFFDNFQVLPQALRRLDLAEGEVVGHYRVIRPLGQGGMGSVYLAQDMAVDRKVALKTLPRRLTQEQELHARLQHPNIAVFFESGTTKDGYGYFAMEYVDGQPITDYCDGANLGLEKRLALFLQVCDAVSFAHRNLVVHRDIKPSNILVAKEGLPKLLDFGIAKLLPSGDDLLTLTRPEERSLTLAFASPEQLQGERTTTATDIYSLGVLLCLLLTGRLPYPVESYHDLPWAIRHMEANPPSRLVLTKKETDEEKPSPAFPSGSTKLSRTLRGDLDAIVLKAVRKEPEKRYQTVSELASDIQRYLADEPVSAVKGSTRYKARKFVRRHAGLVVTTAVAALIILALLVGLFLEQRETARQRDEAGRQIQRAEAVSDFLTRIFEIADPLKTTAETVTARQLLDQAAQNIEKDQKIDPLSKASFLDTLGDSYFNLGLYDRASVLYGTSLTIRRTMGGDYNPLTWKSIRNLGLVAAHQGRYKDAKQLYLKALSLQRSPSGSHRADIALTLYDLGITLRNLAEYKDAERTLSEALKMRRAVAGTDDLVTVSCLSELAKLQEDLGNLPEAEKLYRTAIPVAQKQLGTDHPVVADLLGNLAIILEEQHRLDEANALASTALMLEKRRFGSEHPNIAGYLDLLGRIEYQRKNNSDALRFLKEALAIKIRFIGSSHPQVAVSLTALGVLEMDAGHFGEAENYFRQAYKIYNASYGLNHPDTATAIHDIASALRHEGKISEAERLYRLSLSIYQGHFKEPNIQVAITKYELAWVLGDEGRYTDALSFIDEAITDMRQSLGPRHPKVASAIQKKADLLIKQRRFAEAIQLDHEAIRIFDEKLTPGDPVRESANVVMASALLGLHRFDGAERLLLETLHTLKSSKEPRPNEVKATLKELISLYDSWNKPQEAAKYRKLLAEASPNTTQ